MKRTSWSPASFKKNKYADTGARKRTGSESNRSTSRSKSETRQVNRNAGGKSLNFDATRNDTSVYYSSKGSLHGGISMNEEKYYAQISDLKSEYLKKIKLFIFN